MVFLITLVATLAAVTILKPVIKAAPWVFYILAIVADIILIVGTSGGFPRGLGTFTTLLLRRGFLALALFVIVMYIGVLPHGSKVRNYFVSIRAILSITACILIAGHICSYFASYVGSLFGGVLAAPIVVAICAGILLLVLGLVLGVTSFKFVRKHMSGKQWLNIQKLAYVFYALVYAHSMFLLLPPAVSGGEAARISVAVYSAVFGLYLVLRIYRANVNKRNAQQALAQREEEWSEQAVGF